MRNIFTLFVILAILGLTACKKESNDPAGCSAAWATEVEAELDAVIAALNAYSADPTAETCNDYKEAYLDYIDALEPFLECSTYTTEQRQQIQAVIDEAQETADGLCSEY